MGTRNLIDEEYEDLAREFRGRLFERLRAAGRMDIPLRELPGWTAG